MPFRDRVRRGMRKFFATVRDIKSRCERRSAAERIARFKSWVTSRTSWAAGHTERVVTSVTAGVLTAAVAGIFLWGWAPVTGVVLGAVGLFTLGQLTASGTKRALNWLARRRDHRAPPQAGVDIPDLTNQAVPDALPEDEQADQANVDTPDELKSDERS